ncbi:glycosyltransferase [Providencia alcalifaciens]|uniref:WpaA n=1 Tax=Providencia alcalifaciens TaxID=126385 RepID=F8RC08_9GAMM|nr:glycosyltransferase [Providencia alcalifaciens]AEB61515.1 WpaA [Providencia alcalifaciens]MTC30471.1 glycosyltransferase [Providencia alcalifaciens]
MNKEIISVGVLSYNSEKTILETLNSILSQDYGSKHIELLIGDDASTDNSQKIIKNWVDINRDAFHEVKILFQNRNKGVVNNFNFVCYNASSCWIKPIAADDILINNCITELVLFSKENKTAKCIFCKVQKFNEASNLGSYPRNNYYFNLTAEKQFQALLIDNFVPAPGAFLELNFLKKMGFAEKHISMEDYPLWLKITSKNSRLYLLEKELVKYRIGNSLSNSTNRLINTIINKDVYSCKIRYLKEYTGSKPMYLLLLWDIKLSRLNDFIRIYIFKNKKKPFYNFLSSIFRLLSPLFLMRKITFLSK